MKQTNDINDLTVEDCVELVASISNFKFSTNPELHDLHSFTLHEDNHRIMFSIAKQVFRGTALTHKQHELVKKLLVEYYAEQFAKHNIAIKDHLDNLRLPIRKLDSSHWVELEEVSRDGNTETMIVIRFPFNKKVISRLEELKNGNDKNYFYEKHKHFFPLTEKYIWKLVNIAMRFEQKFDIDESVMSVYNELTTMDKNSFNYIPGIKDNKFINYIQHGIDCATADLGLPTESNLYQYYDRKDYYGLEYFDQEQVQHSLRANNCSSLTTLIVERKTTEVCINDITWPVTEFGQTLYELDRFPLLVVLDETSCMTQLNRFHSVLSNYIPSSQMSVMFRLENEKFEYAREFNQFIHTKGLNNYVDKNTKVVYISNNKVPKPLYKSDWYPIASLVLTRQAMRNPELYINGIDLVMYYDQGSTVSGYNLKWQDRVENI